MDYQDLQREAWDIAEENGFHPGPSGKDIRGRPQILSLVHSEVSEALEADREGDDDHYGEELADIVIRVMDHAESEHINLDAVVGDAPIDVSRDRPAVLCEMHFQLSTARAADRMDAEKQYARKLGDVVACVVDHAAYEGIDLERVIEEKNAENRTREERHGKKY